MTKEELKAHCEKQINECEMWAKYKGEEPHGKVYEEHKLILELLERESIFDKIKDEFIDRYPRNYANELELGGRSCVFSLNDVLRIIDKYKSESEG